MKDCSGFSLIELSIVIALCSIIMGLGMTYGTYMYRGLVQQEVEKLAVVCRYLQHAAMVSNERKILAFDLKKRCYTYDGSPVELPKQVDFGVVKGVKGPPATPSRPIEVPISFKDNNIIFSPDGIIQPGTVYLIGKNTRIMYALSCSVGQVSYLRVYTYDGSWQCVS